MWVAEEKGELMVECGRKCDSVRKGTSCEGLAAEWRWICLTDDNAVLFIEGGNRDKSLFYFK